MKRAKCNLIARDRQVMESDRIESTTHYGIVSATLTRYRAVLSFVVSFVEGDCGTH